jgi:methylamine dehydrogenase heavy chain
MRHLATAFLLSATLAHAQLPVEALGKVRTLPVPYPAHWVLVHDGAFFHMNDGRVVLLDADAGTGPAQYKGMLDNTFMGAFTVARARRELVMAESFYTRGHRGERTDVLTIHDQATLAPKGEVVLPGAKRYTGMPERYSLQLIDSERLALVFNQNPASSVTVVDLDARRVLGDIDTSGCALVFPTGKRGFSSLCGDGAFLSHQLDANGKSIATERSKPLWDVDADPLFEKPAIIDGIAYFPSFGGQVLPVDLRGAAARAGKPWSLLGKGDQAEGWRPGGWQFIDTDRSGHMHVLMHPQGGDGTHKNPGTEVRVYDPRKRTLLRRIALKHPAISLALTRDAEPLLVVTALDEHERMNMDVYSARDGSFLRTLAPFGQETPFVVYAVNGD